MPAPAQPNFLFIITDQHRADHIGAYGNPMIRTPNIDGIAARGLRFDRFYVSSPICMPNRATLMTGQIPSVAGVPTNGLPLPLEATTFVDILRAEGYRTALVGKCHLQNMVPTRVDESNYPPWPPGRRPAEPFHEARRRAVSGPGYDAERADLWVADPDREIRTPFYGFDEVRFANLHGDRVQGHYTRWLRDRHPDPDSLRGPDNAMSNDGISAPQAWRTRMPEELYPTSFVKEQAIEVLEGFAAEPGKPFFMQMSFPDPHHPFTPPGKYWDMYDPDDIAVPASHGAPHTDRSTLMRRFQDELARGVAKRDHVHPYACSPREAQETIALTYGMITMIDDAIGAVLDRLAALGLAEDTIVVFTSDHGDLMGDHGLMLKHGFHQEGLIRTPFIWSEPGDPPGSTDILSGTIDISATVLGRLGIAPPNGTQGFDILAAKSAGQAPPRAGIYIEEDQLPINANLDYYMRMRTLVTGRWRITIWEGDPLGELHDRQEDPLELVNLWNDPGAQATKADLLETMMRERLRLDYRGPRAEYCA